MTKIEMIEERIDIEQRTFAVQTSKNKLRVKNLHEALAKEIEGKEKIEKEIDKLKLLEKAFRKACLENLPLTPDLRLVIAQALLNKPEESEQTNYVGM